MLREIEPEAISVSVKGNLMVVRYAMTCAGE